ncbi:hypothetical protein RYD26_10215 [Pasteurellaceae bacterium LIM206]|nr:hypothetical protein [Pasteurellaceae bacterium LIM206]
MKYKFRMFELPFYIVTFIYLAIFLYDIIDNYNLLFYNEARNSYRSYYDITADVQKYKISGRLNKHITIRNQNDKCYALYCGLPKSGLYKLTEIQFIYLDKKPFLFKICTTKEECFYNLSDNFIKDRKENKRKDIKSNLFWGLIFVLVSIANHIFMRKVILQLKTKGKL